MVTGTFYKVGILLLCVLCSGFFTKPANAQEQLVEVTVTPAVMPGPGHSSQWTMTITGVSSKPVALSLSLEKVSADKEALLGLLTISVEDDKGNVVLAPTLAKDIGVTPVSLGDLVGSQMVLTGTEVLDVSADNQYQNVSADLAFNVIATAADTETPVVTPVSAPLAAMPVFQDNPGVLAYTGFAVATLVVLASLMFVFGFFFKVFRERRRS